MHKNIYDPTPVGFHSHALPCLGSGAALITQTSRRLTRETFSTVISDKHQSKPPCVWCVPETGVIPSPRSQPPQSSDVLRRTDDARLTAVCVEGSGGHWAGRRWWRPADELKCSYTTHSPTEPQPILQLHIQQLHTLLSVCSQSLLQETAHTLTHSHTQLSFPGVVLMYQFIIPDNPNHDVLIKKTSEQTHRRAGRRRETPSSLSPNTSRQFPEINSEK